MGCQFLSHYCDSTWKNPHGASGNETPEVHCPARRMLVNAREWCNNTSQVALFPTLIPVTKARSNARGAGRSLAFKTRWRMCFSVSHTSRSWSFVFKQTFSLFLMLTDKTRTAVKVIYLLISVQFIFFHALWMAIFFSFYFSQQQHTMLVTWSCSNVQSTWETAKTKAEKYLDEL